MAREDGGGAANEARATATVLSVVLPVYNAMPWLPIAVRDILKQDLGGEGLELMCADDASRDSSLAFLRELAALLGDRDPKVLQREHLRPMLDAGELAHTFPQMPNHPQQRYTLPAPDPA